MNQKYQKLPMKILLVDDHDDTRDSIQAWLESEGHTTFTARDVKSAIKVGCDNPFELMLCDIQLPDGNGRTILEKLGGPSKILAVAISGHGNAADLAQSK